MARFNDVILQGINMHDPRIAEDMSMGTTQLLVIRSDREVEDNDKKNRLDSPLVMTKDTDIVNQLAEIEENDIIQIKGVLVTKTINKTTICPECGKEFSTPGTIVYIEPINILKIKSCKTKDQAIDMLHSLKEVSNNIKIIGDLCTEPEKVKIVNKKIGSICQYQIAVPRKYRLKNQNDDVDTDYPWVKSYGKNADKDLEHLQKGAEILIDGYIQARSFTRRTTCPDCGKEYEWRDNAMEIVPFATEYLKNYKKTIDATEDAEE